MRLCYICDLFKWSSFWLIGKWFNEIVLHMRSFYVGPFFGWSNPLICISIPLPSSPKPYLIYVGSTLWFFFSIHPSHAPIEALSHLSSVIFMNSTFPFRSLPVSPLPVHLTCNTFTTSLEAAFLPCTCQTSQSGLLLDFPFNLTTLCYKFNEC